MAATLHPVTPFIPAGPDIQAAIDFYTRVLGFAVRWNAGDYVCVGRDSAEIILQRMDDRHTASQLMLQIKVHDVAALAAEYAGRDFSPGQLGALEVKPWGNREMHVIDHYGVCLHFLDAQHP
ncbi:MAG TPA: VOC family protein [Polyangia bacterium]|jgi:catechol 2,3-dioxygenase-like lactoylglutathione lyase family enzyme|nr:VOC family protein [Polyangia bacterium]